jgi:hypothetical protein
MDACVSSKKGGESRFATDNSSSAILASGRQLVNEAPVDLEFQKLLRSCVNLAVLDSATSLLEYRSFHDEYMNLLGDQKKKKRKEEEKENS